ncbi:hypothetical protein BDQ17DRAFT_1437214 [Cyathus striatus]|nr:hypothetical protein BDQ17DRAFT_1437214 [Cyathus striatus]
MSSIPRSRRASELDNIQPERAVRPRLPNPPESNSSSRFIVLSPQKKPRQPSPPVLTGPSIETSFHADYDINISEPSQNDAVDNMQAEHSGVDNSFQAYQDCVTYGDVMFEQISHELFVVQGWDYKRKSGQHYIDIFGREMFLNVADVPKVPSDIKLFKLEKTANGMQYWFTVRSGDGLTDRVFVTYDGEKDGTGNWECRKCRISCAHIRKAQELLPQSTEGSADGPEATDDSFGSGPQQDKAISYLAIMPRYGHLRN